MEWLRAKHRFDWLPKVVSGWVWRQSNPLFGSHEHVCLCGQIFTDDSDVERNAFSWVWHDVELRLCMVSRRGAHSPLMQPLGCSTCPLFLHAMCVRAVRAQWHVLHRNLLASLTGFLGEAAAKKAVDYVWHVTRNVRARYPASV